MNLKMVLSVYGAFMAVSGAAALVAPSALLSLLYGVPPLDAMGLSLVRMLLAADIGLGVMCWTARTAEPSKARDALILGLVVVNGLWAVVAVLAAMDARLWLLWADAAGFALVAVLFIVAGRRAMSAPTAGGGAST